MNKLLLLVAGSVFFLHAIIPHHHSNEHVCFDIAHEARDKTLHDCHAEGHNRACNDHEDPTEEESLFCGLYQLVTVPDNQLKLHEGFEKVLTLDPNFAAFAVFTDTSVFFGELVSTSYASPPSQFSYTSPEFTSHGLRAPPGMG